jgi:hypothetical protein
MGIVLLIWGVLAAVYGLIVLGAAKSAVHEIEAGLGFLIATVAFGCAGIIDAVNRMREKRSYLER